ncbi:hypothetical protein [Bacillus sp. YBsi01]|uniref:hypothetical protein n=1 Tax=Bacillus sp. YBsi01 TaxID=3139388 RepID=UPI0031398EE9
MEKKKKKKIWGGGGGGGGVGGFFCLFLFVRGLEVGDDKVMIKFGKKVYDEYFVIGEKEGFMIMLGCLEGWNEGKV